MTPVSLRLCGCQAASGSASSKFVDDSCCGCKYFWSNNNNKERDGAIQLCGFQQKKKTKQQTYHAESVKQTYRTQRKEAGSGDNSAAGVTRIILFAYETITRPFFPSLNVTFRCNRNIPFVSTTVFLESITFKQIQVQNPSIQPAHLTLYRWKCTFLWL